MRKALLEKLPEYRHTNENVVKDFHFDLITPMLGGDSDSWKLNAEAPVRAQSVKGQLRFWWRTMQPNLDHNTLLQLENSVWGGKIDQDTRIQAPVKIAIMDQTVKKIHQAELNDKGFAVKDEVIPAYVAFPVTPAIKQDKKDVIYVQELRFVLRVTFPLKHEKTVLDTLRLWMLFGGVGARTRRGCGSVYCEELMKPFIDAKSILDFIRTFGAYAKPSEVPKIHGATLAFAPPASETSTAWFSLINAYADFRQARTPTQPTPGRSYWPEPDAIRTLVKQQARLHAPEHPDGVWFPRAAFGLPILTKFNTRGNGQGDPDPQVELKPKNGERWPSPLILKVLRLADGRVLKTALVLSQQFPASLVLKQGQSEYHVPKSAHPFAPEAAGKIMKKPAGEQLGDGESIYQALFRKLNLKEAP